MLRLARTFHVHVEIRAQYLLGEGLQVLYHLAVIVEVTERQLERRIQNQASRINPFYSHSIRDADSSVDTFVKLESEYRYEQGPDKWVYNLTTACLQLKLKKCTFLKKYCEILTNKNRRRRLSKRPFYIPAYNGLKT